MKIQVLSDLHLEMLKPAYSWRIPVTAADAIVLAGDIGVGDAGIRWAIGESERLGKPILYVSGNHEYYQQRFEVLDQMRAMARGTGVYLLEMDAVVLNSVRFLGTTLWTDYLLFGGLLRPAMMHHAGRLLNDHRLINQPDGFTPEDALARHEDARQWLLAELAKPCDLATVVVTHHAPSVEGIHPTYREDNVSCAFASDLEDVIEAYWPALWIHGHTHHCADYAIAHTRVVANQLGYPHEPASGKFDPSLVIDPCAGPGPTTVLPVIAPLAPVSLDRSDQRAGDDIYLVDDREALELVRRHFRLDRMVCSVCRDPQRIVVGVLTLGGRLTDDAFLPMPYCAECWNAIPEA